MVFTYIWSLILLVLIHTGSVSDGFSLDISATSARPKDLSRDQKDLASDQSTGTVLVYDTTLRDGSQSPLISLSLKDKKQILTKLVDAKVDFIEGGYPGSNEKDREFFRWAADETNLPRHQFKKLVAFGSTRRKNSVAKKDPQLKMLVESGVTNACIVAKGSLKHVETILSTTGDENLAMLHDSVSFLRSSGLNVFVDFEHFYDGYIEDPSYSNKLINTAVEAGASQLVLCDTNGGNLPNVITSITSSLPQLPSSAMYGIHCHNDLGLAVANTLAAVEAGCGVMQGTINGVGERTGNADLITLTAILNLRLGLFTSLDPKDLTKLSTEISSICRLERPRNQPFVGYDAFAHKGGLHAAAMAKDPTSYQFINASEVGNEGRVCLSDLSGRGSVMTRLKEAGFDGGGEEFVKEKAEAILNRLKSLEAKGYSFEGADASITLMMLHATKTYCPPFKLLDFSTSVNEFNEQKWGINTLGWNVGADTSRATVRVQALVENDWEDGNGGTVERVTMLEAADGNGPVDAVTKAMKKGLRHFFPVLKDVSLIDYNVAILDNENATEASSRVQITFALKSKPSKTWSTVSVSTNTISASVNALVDGFEYAILNEESQNMLCDIDWDTTGNGWE